MTSWQARTDPFGMLRELGERSPGRHLAVTEALVARMAPLLPVLERVAARQAVSQPGMHTDGRDPFDFNYLADRVRRALTQVPDADRDALCRALADAIRAVVPDPDDVRSDWTDSR